MHLRRNTNLYNKGFTLVETLVAIIVLLLVIIGPMTIAQRGIQNSYYANEQSTAVFLAQEALEAVRSLRDNNALVVSENPAAFSDTTKWYQDLHSECKNSYNCDFDLSYHPPHVKPCSSTPRCKLSQKMDGDTIVYGYGQTGGWEESIYTRKVYVYGDASSGWKVTVTVSWTSPRLGAKSITLQSWIYDQYRP